MPAITLDHLSKTYDNGKKAVDSVCLRLEQGEIFGFLGPNGAGKTTTVKLLSGMLTPTGGSCSLLGINPAHHPETVHGLCGVVTEHAQMYHALTGLQNLEFYGALFGLSPAKSRQRADALLSRLELSDAAHQKLASYSTGMRQRLSLARALMHEPPVLFLDEPTSGLDPRSAQNVNALLRSLAREKGITVFLCTHQLRYAQEICTRYGLMDRGRLLAEGSLDALRARLGLGMRVKIRASGGSAPASYRKTGENTYEICIQTQEEIPPLVRMGVESGMRIYSVCPEQPSLEDLYFHLTAHQKEA